MTQLREDLSDCAVGDIVFEDAANALPTAFKLFVAGRPSNLPYRNEAECSASLFRPHLEFERAIATLPGSTAKVRVWQRVS